MFWGIFVNFELDFYFPRFFYIFSTHQNFFNFFLPFVSSPETFENEVLLIKRPITFEDIGCKKKMLQERRDMICLRKNRTFKKYFEEI